VPEHNGVPFFRSDATTPCPWCGAQQDAVTPLGHDSTMPRAGDFSVCADCNKIVVFTGVGLQRRKPTRAEALEAAAHRVAGPAQRFIRRYHEGLEP
jgi:hypothetical protein